MGSIQMGFPPQVTISNPGNGAVLTVPTNIYVHAVASDPDGMVASLSIYANGELLATTNGPEISMVWVPRQAGELLTESHCHG